MFKLTTWGVCVLDALVYLPSSFSAVVRGGGLSGRTNRIEKKQV
jgi:hypothetical protein